MRIRSFVVLLVGILLGNGIAVAQEGQALGLTLSAASAGGFPLGLPPGKPEPGVLTVAPEDVGAFLTWSELAKPDPGSSNRTEKLLARKDVQAMIGECVTFIGESMGPDEKAKVVFPVVKLIAQRPTSIYVADRDARLRIGFATHLGGGLSIFRPALDLLLKSEADTIEETTIDGPVSYTHLTLPTKRIV